MFGSVAPLLDMSGGLETHDFEKISIRALFELLLALELQLEDELDLLELVDGDKPLTALVRQPLSRVHAWFMQSRHEVAFCIVHLRVCV